MTDDAPDRGREAAEHLQKAALEFIEAARALLDVAEEAVREPGGVANIVTETVSAVLGAVRAPGGDHRDGTDLAGGIEHVRIR
jgi:hypothetical protein